MEGERERMDVGVEGMLMLVPKLLVLGGALALLGPFMANSLADYTHVLMDRLIVVGGQ